MLAYLKSDQPTIHKPPMLASAAHIGCVGRSIQAKTKTQRHENNYKYYEYSNIARLFERERRIKP